MQNFCGYTRKADCFVLVLCGYAFSLTISNSLFINFKDKQIAFRFLVVNVIWDFGGGFRFDNVSLTFVILRCQVKNAFLASSNSFLENINLFRLF